MDMKLNNTFYILLVVLFIACKPVSNTGRDDTNSSDTSDLTKRHQITLIEVSSNQLILNGTNLSTISAVKTKNGPQVINLNILSKSANMVRLGVPNGLKIVGGFIYDLIVTDAFGQTVTSVSFDVQNSSISTSKIQDGAITNSKLSSLGASSAGQVLQYNGASWVAVDYLGGSNYLGRLILDTGGGVTAPSVAGVNNGDFYVVNDAAPVAGDLNGDGNVETFTAGDIIRFNESTNKWDLQLSNGSYAGPWDINGSHIRRTGSGGKVTISDDPYEGPSKLTVSGNIAGPTTAEESILLHVGGNVSSGLGSSWARALSFGLRQEHNATMGVYGNNTNVGGMNFFFIDVDGDGDSLASNFWNSAEFFIDSAGRTSIGGVPDPLYLFYVYGNSGVNGNLNVSSTITAANFVGDGSGITNINAVNMTNSGTTTITAGSSGPGDIAFQSESSDFALYDANGNLSFGHTSNLGTFNATAQIDVRSDSGDASGQFYSYGGNQSSINLASSQGLITAPSMTTASDVLGLLNFGGDTGSGIVNTASIRSTATENFSATNLGTELNFYTTANTTNTQQENMRLTHNGRLLVGSTAVSDTSGYQMVVGGSTQLAGNLNVTGISQLSNTIVSGTLSHSGNLSTTNLTASGTIQGNGITSTGGLTNTGAFNTTGAAVVNGTLQVTGNATFDSDITVTGDVDFGNISVNTIAGDATTSSAFFGQVTSAQKIISQGGIDNVVFKGGTLNNFEVLVDNGSGIKLGNLNTAGAVGSNLPVTISTANTDRMTVTAAGRVGVGTTTPSEQFHVVGNLRVQGSTDCTLGAGAGATNCTSDKRLKDNVTEIDHALDKIKALKGVEFDWNEKSLSPGMHSIGVIAQDVQAQFPTAVIENADGWLSVDYAVLVSPLIEAVKELDENMAMYKVMSEGVEAQVSTNTREIASLKEENNKLKEENEEMREALCSLNQNFKFCQ